MESQRYYYFNLKLNVSRKEHTCPPPQPWKQLILNPQPAEGSPQLFYCGLQLNTHDFTTKDYFLSCPLLSCPAKTRCTDFQGERLLPSLLS